MAASPPTSAAEDNAACGITGADPSEARASPSACIANSPKRSRTDSTWGHDRAAALPLEQCSHVQSTTHLSALVIIRPPALGGPAGALARAVRSGAILATTDVHRDRTQSRDVSVSGAMATAKMASCDAGFVLQKTPPKWHGRSSPCTPPVRPAESCASREASRKGASSSASNRTG